MITLIAIATFVSTLLGGLFALKLKDKLHLILGFSAGAVIAVAFFDLMPEALELGSKHYANGTIFTAIAVGFLFYLVLDRVIFLHAHIPGDQAEGKHSTEALSSKSRKIGRGILGAGSLSIHSFLDGVAVGLAFQVSTAIGIVVAAAVLTHDFSDGINTVSLILKNDGERKQAFRWLIVDASAPVLGIIFTLFFTVPEKWLSVILALFAGFFLYIGASDLIPESQHAHPKLLTTIMTLVGGAVLYLVIKIASF
jgi:ZIP family zinc transporter